MVDSAGRVKYCIECAERTLPFRSTLLSVGCIPCTDFVSGITRAPIAYYGASPSKRRTCVSASPESMDMIEQLVRFDTTSRNSNLELIAYIQNYLEKFGVKCELVHNEERTKANLYATLGPKDRPGIALSGHTDVVPVDGQDWKTNPFEVQELDGRLYGRGTSDMKSFIGVCLALAPKFLQQPIQTPLHLAFSYDEEVGCLGVRDLIDQLSGRAAKPIACIIGEPTPP